MAETSALRVLAHPLRLRMLSPLTGASFSASVTLHERAKPPRTTGTVRVSVSAALFAMADRSATPAGE